MGFPVSSSITVNQIESTQPLNVTVKDSDPGRATQIANAIVSVFGDQILADQTTRYADLKTNLEQEMANIDNRIAEVNQKLG
jgi:capsular polysaccharide biosynthesis protein